MRWEVQQAPGCICHPRLFSSTAQNVCLEQAFNEPGVVGHAAGIVR